LLLIGGFINHITDKHPKWRWVEPYGGGLPNDVGFYNAIMYDLLKFYSEK